MKYEIIFFQKQPSDLFYKKLFLKISQNSQENICDRASFLIKFQPAPLLTHFSPMSHFYTPENVRKLWFSDVFRGYRNVTLD